MLFSQLKFNNEGLIPAIVQDSKTSDVLMLAYMNEESLLLTIKENLCVFYSRSRNEIWRKGETSGNFLNVKDIYFDCDMDAILIKAEPINGACHTGQYSCFFNHLSENEDVKEITTKKSEDLLSALYNTIKERKENPKKDSYTNYLFDKGIDKILKKVGEESAEVIIGAKNASKEEVTYEAADLMYHLSVLLCQMELTWDDIYNELEKRQK